MRTMNCVGLRGPEIHHPAPGTHLTKMHHDVATAVKRLQRTQRREQVCHATTERIHRLEGIIRQLTQYGQRGFVAVKERLRHCSHRWIDCSGYIIHALRVFRKHRVKTFWSNRPWLT